MINVVSVLLVCHICLFIQPPGFILLLGIYTCQLKQLVVFQLGSESVLHLYLGDYKPPVKFQTYKKL